MYRYVCIRPATEKKPCIFSGGVMFDIQKANVWKRISAYLFDAILLVIAAVGFAFILSGVLGYSRHYGTLVGYYDKYEAEYGVDFDITEEEREKLTETEKEKYTAASEAIAKDEELGYVYNLLINLSFIIIIFGILLAYLMLELAVPLLFKNGQTLGKKIFGIAVIREDGVRISGVALFARTVLGKYTVETMVPILVIIMTLFGSMGVFGVTVLGILVIAQIMLVAMGPYRQCIHDKLSGTVAVDFASQMIFDSPEKLLEHKNRIQAERAQSRER